jgi:hypothetical protein
MFIVAMTIAVIGAMGIYALQTASMEVKTAGFVRQQLQTQYLSQFGIGASAQALAVNPQVYASVMTQQPDGGCFSLYGIWSQPNVTPQAAACHRAGSVELGGQVVPPGTPAQVLVTPFMGANSDATRGVIGLPMAPDFFVEVTDPTQRQPPPGYATNSSATVCFLEVTSSTMGLTPTTSIYNAGDTFNTMGSAGFLSEGFEMARARIMFGPVQCTSTN